jgi:hypothetical protein
MQRPAPMANPELLYKMLTTGGLGTQLSSARGRD